MRKILFFCLVGLIATACTETGEEHQTEQPIRFSASAGGVTVMPVTSTKAGNDVSSTFIANSIADLKDSIITLYGTEYLTGATTKSWDFMGGWASTVKQSGSSYAFDYATGNHMKYYMPDDRARYDFRAVFPSVSEDTASAVSQTTQGFPHVRVKLKYLPDLMVATVDGAAKNTVPLGSIPLKFEHQLALVTFNIYKDIESQTLPPGESHNIYLNKMTLAGRTIADFNVVDKEFTGVDAKTGATVRVPGYPYSDFLIKKDPEKIRDLFLFAADGNVVAEQYTFDFIINERSYKAVLPGSGKRWEKGLQYIYTIKVVGSDVYVELGDSDDDDMQLEQEEWDDEDMGEPIEGQ